MLSGGDPWGTLGDRTRQNSGAVGRRWAERLEPELSYDPQLNPKRHINELGRLLHPLDQLADPILTPPGDDLDIETHQAMSWHAGNVNGVTVVTPRGVELAYTGRNLLHRYRSHHPGRDDGGDAQAFVAG